MLRPVLFGKLHMATLTACKPNYIGSITIDAELLEAAGMRVNDKVLIANCRNGERFETYIFRGEPGSRCVELNGAVSHLAEPGDKLIIMHFALMTDEEYARHRPKAIIMRDDNSIEKTMRYEPGA